MFLFTSNVLFTAEFKYLNHICCNGTAMLCPYRVVYLPENSCNINIIKSGLRSPTVGRSPSPIDKTSKTYRFSTRRARDANASCIGCRHRPHYNTGNLRNVLAPQRAGSPLKTNNQQPITFQALSHICLLVGRL